MFGERSINLKPKVMKYQKNPNPYPKVPKKSFNKKYQL
jgi:hypothetical protein